MKNRIITIEVINAALAVSLIKRAMDHHNKRTIDTTITNGPQMTSAFVCQTFLEKRNSTGYMPKRIG
jgi:hypothetical protein